MKVIVVEIERVDNGSIVTVGFKDEPWARKFIHESSYGVGGKIENAIDDMVENATKKAVPAISNAEVI